MRAEVCVEDQLNSSRELHFDINTLELSSNGKTFEHINFSFIWFVDEAGFEAASRKSVTNTRKRNKHHEANSLYNHVSEDRQSGGDPQWARGGHAVLTDSNCSTCVALVTHVLHWWHMCCTGSTHIVFYEVKLGVRTSLSAKNFPWICYQN